MLLALAACAPSPFVQNKTQFAAPASMPTATRQAALDLRTAPSGNIARHSVVRKVTVARKPDPATPAVLDAHPAAKANSSSYGVASFYTEDEWTASGERFNTHAMTAAHPTLPLPSYARVTNPANGKSVVVRVNDRGPFHPGRIIDLSYAAAWRLGIAQMGSGEVEVMSVLPSGIPAVAAAQPLPPVPAAPAVVATPVAQEPGGYVVQLGAFGSNANAQAFVGRLTNQIAGLSVEAKVHEADGLFRVVVGPYPTRDEARRTGERLRVALGLDNVVRAQ